MNKLIKNNTNDPVKNILIVGVGGQGTILASRILANVLLSEGYDIKISEIHGMSQRGGSVVTQVRYGKKVYSPIITPGEADVILAFEQLEALRALPYLNDNGTIIVSSQKIFPMPVVIGAAKYPENILTSLKAKTNNVFWIDALEAALSCNNPKGVNIVLIGMLSCMMDIEIGTWTRVISETVPERFLECNLAAFEAGRKLYK